MCHQAEARGGFGETGCERLSKLCEQSSLPTTDMSALNSGQSRASGFGAAKFEY